MKRIILAIAVVVLAVMAVASSALAGVDRYQETTTTTKTATFRVTQPAGAVNQWDNLWTHDYTVTVNQDGTFTGKGTVSGADQSGSFSDTETISGTLATDSISLKATRDSDGLEYRLDNAKFGDAITIATLNVSVPWVIEMKVSTPVITTTTSTSDFKNHGDYVSSMGGGAEAAHSPIGKPIKSK